MLIGADMPTLQIGQEIRKGKPSEPIAVKRNLSWVLMGGKLGIYHHCLTCLTSQLCNAFLRIRNLCTRPKTDPTLLPNNEQKAIKVLEDTVEKMTGNHYSVGLLWKEHWLSFFLSFFKFI